MLIEPHNNETTYVGCDPDENPRKPFFFSCECGIFSEHTSLNAADRARFKHMHDDEVFKAQIAEAEKRVEEAQQRLYRAIQDRVEAQRVYTSMLDNRR